MSNERLAPKETPREVPELKPTELDVRARVERATEKVRQEAAEDPNLCFDRLANEFGRVAREGSEAVGKTLEALNDKLAESRFVETPEGKKIHELLNKASELVKGARTELKENDELVRSIAVALALALMLAVAPESAIELVRQRPEILAQAIEGFVKPPEAK